MPTAEELVAQAELHRKQETEHWYIDDGDKVMNDTDGGRMLYAWKAIYEDGTCARQYDEITFMRALNDALYVPPIDRIISISTVDQDRVRELILYPIAYALRHCPRASTVRVVVNPKKGEKLLVYWCTDVNVTTGHTIRRQVVGIERDGQKLLFVLSPSGTMTLATNDDVSFDGE